MRVLITGITGFLGSEIARACVAAGLKINAIRRPSSSLARLDGIIEHISFYDNTKEGIHYALNSADGCEAIIHAATCYGRQGEEWTTLVETNNLFPLCILEVAEATGVKCFINIDTVLDSRINAYALSKRQFSEWGRFLSENGQMRFVNVRLEHLYGPGDHNLRFVTSIIRQCLSNSGPIELTDGRQMQDFIYIDDAVSGIMHLLLSREFIPLGWAEFDLGSGHPVSIRELVEQIHRAINSKAQLNFGKLPSRKYERNESKADNSRLKELGWRSRTSLADGIKKTIDYERVKLMSE